MEQIHQLMKNKNMHGIDEFEDYEAMHDPTKQDSFESPIKSYEQFSSAEGSPDDPLLKMISHKTPEI